jgi:hypothetical protein
MYFFFKHGPYSFLSKALPKYYLYVFKGTASGLPLFLVFVYLVELLLIWIQSSGPRHQTT